MIEIPDFTVVCGVDIKHLEQLAYTYPIWKKYKLKSLGLDGSKPMLVFFDWTQLDGSDVLQTVHHPKLDVVPWPTTGGKKVEYEGTPGGRWDDPQRYKMLAGFVYAARKVKTSYMLKVDTDVVATGMDDWIDPDWFAKQPAIVSHPWGYTKPPDQMQKLDEWVERTSGCLQEDNSLSHCSSLSPLIGRPKPGEDKLRHPRIISFVGFFSTAFVQDCADLAEGTCGPGKLPVPSQDGFCWYCATRWGLPVVRVNLKQRGWQQWSGTERVRQKAAEAMRT